MRKIQVTIIILITIILFVSCVSSSEYVGILGKLPANWWEKDIAEIQNRFRNTSTGESKNVLIFVGYSDFPSNKTQTIAIYQARLDAQMQLSQYLTQKLTGIVQSKNFSTTLEEELKDAGASNEEIITSKGILESAFSQFMSDFASTQFSSFKEESHHTNKADGYYEAWVCYSVSDQILEESQKLQDQAFRTLLEESGAYKETMIAVNEEIALQVKDALISEVFNE